MRMRRWRMGAVLAAVGLANLVVYGMSGGEERQLLILGVVLLFASVATLLSLGVWR